MNIVVIEDERNTRDGLIRLIDKYTTHTVVGHADNGEDGKRISLELRPDVVITDVQMPGCNGLDMIEELREESFDFDAVILSGFSDFEYARKAIKLEVQEYLLKPITVEDLNVCLSNIEQKRSKEYRFAGSIQEMVSCLLSCEESEKDRQVKNLQVAMRIHEKTALCAVLVKLDAVDRQSQDSLFHALRDRLDLMCFADCHLLNLPFGYGILILSSDAQNNPMFERQIKQYVLDRCDCAAPFRAASVRFSDLSLLEQKIINLRGLVCYSLLTDEAVLVNQEWIDTLAITSLQYPQELEDTMTEAMFQNNPVLMRKTADDFIHAMFHQCCEPGQLISGFEQFLTNLFSACRELMRCDSETEKFQSYIKQVTGAWNRDTLCDNFQEAVELVINRGVHQDGVQNLIILKVINHIRSHYSDDITLSQMAEMLNVTPEYLSRLFNKEMKINFSAFLKHFRISTAKRLLLSGELQIQQVAEHVGFHDPKYFNRVFKSVCGQSPSDFIKKGG